MAEVAATAEPDTAPNIMQESTLTCPSPPRTRPSTDSARRTSLPAMPDWFISSPA